MNHKIYIPISENACLANTALILPVYNSARHLPILIPQLLEIVPPHQIIAVNDGSQDDSANICRNLQVNLLNFDHNQGKGAALLAGMKHAQKLGFLFAFTLDSDEQHNPRHIPQFLSSQNSIAAGIVLGKRKFDSSLMPWQRICSNKLTSFLVSIAIRKKISDSQCGYRLYYLEPIMQLNLKTKRYQFETEILLKMADLSYRIAETDVDTVYGNETSHINHLRDITNFVKILGAHWFKN
ncbi:MAG: glycosyltransferase family 2 protein [Candidatus Cloacimonetes bacterium]|nr:glycosyltransferase family 2 protein [Candidatus Cloacimonadota bacterium]